jgi:hypothetical protein
MAQTIPQTQHVVLLDDRFYTVLAGPGVTYAEAVDAVRSWLTLRERQRPRPPG